MNVSFHPWIVVAMVVLAARCPLAADPTRPPPPDSIPRLPVTTGWLGNSLLRGGQADWSDQSQTYLQLYTDDMVVAEDGTVFCTTNWEEGHRPAGIYKDGDALPDAPMFHTTSGAAVAVTRGRLAYGQKGRVAVFTRGKDGKLEAASGRHIVFDSGQDAPQVTGLALDEAGDAVFIADESGVIRTYRFSDGKAIDTKGFPATRPGQMRRDADGNLWVLARPLPTGLEKIPAKVFGSEPREGLAIEDAASTVSEKAYFEARDAAGFVGLDFGEPQPVTLLRFHGAGFDASFKGARLDASATGPDGPWTTLVRFEHEPRGWPEMAITLDGKKWRCLRIAGSKFGLRGLGAFRAHPAEPGRVLKFSPRGEQLAEITDIAEPLGLALDTARDRLLIFDNSAAQQIVAFTGLSGNPRLEERFGDKGRFGKRGGLPTANGAMGDRLFDTVRGLGVDAAGNIYVFNVGGTGMSQSRLESYSPAGVLRWRMTGLAFLDSADLDPGATSDAWSATAHYRRNPAGCDGGGWSAQATTIDRFRFPEDARLNGLAQVLGVRRIGGKRFLFLTNQGGNPIAVYRFDNATGDLAIPCAFLAGIHTSRPWPPHQPPGGGILLWRDRNGDGRFQQDEYEKGDPLIMSPFSADAAGNLWFVREEGKRIVALDAGAPDANGVPGWSLRAERGRQFAFPAVFTEEGAQLRGLEIAPDGASLFAFGFTKSQPSTVGHNYPLGRSLLRYAIAGTNLVQTHQAELPYDCDLAGAAHDQPYSSAIAGDFLFVGYEQRMTVLVYKTATLELVGRIDIGPQSQTPIFDGPPELVVSQRGAEYELFMPQYTGNATTVVTWRPADKVWLPTPTDLRATRRENVVELAWKYTTQATGWRVERRTLESAGWNAWAECGAAKAPDTTWRDLTPPPGACAYRLRALGPDNAASDWSKTSYLR